MTVSWASMGALANDTRPRTKVLKEHVLLLQIPPEISSKYTIFCAVQYIGIRSM